MSEANAQSAGLDPRTSSAPFLVCSVLIDATLSRVSIDDKSNQAERAISTS
jgi:hypothetical protein